MLLFFKFVIILLIKIPICVFFASSQGHVFLSKFIFPKSQLKKRHFSLLNLICLLFSTIPVSSVGRAQD